MSTSNQLLSYAHRVDWVNNRFDRIDEATGKAKIAADRTAKSRFGHHFG
jgi:hypothetical protein